MTEAALHAGYGALRQAALHHGCGRWLIDARRRPNRRLNGPEWVTSAFLPEAQRALGGFLVRFSSQCTANMEGV